MKGFNRLIRDFFSFSRAQANGFIGLLLLVTGILVSEPLYHWIVVQKPEDFSRERRALDSLTAIWESSRVEANRIPPEEEAEVVFFPFDPNTVGFQELRSLGFSERLANRLIKYRNSGGLFRIRADVKKLYGMDSVFYAALAPYIQLPDKIVHANREAKQKAEKVAFDLNEADTLQLQSIYGIGPVLARRVVLFREKLGGFITQEQLYEVYGLDSGVVNRLMEASFLRDGFVPSKIDLNHADEKILAAHPYLSKKIAAAIVTYRFQHGSFKSVDDLQKIQLVDKKVFDKVYPYLTVGDQEL